MMINRVLFSSDQFSGKEHYGVIEFEWCRVSQSGMVLLNLIGVECLIEVTW